MNAEQRRKAVELGNRLEQMLRTDRIGTQLAQIELARAMLDSAEDLEMVQRVGAECSRLTERARWWHDELEMPGTGKALISLQLHPSGWAIVPRYAVVNPRPLP
jgi:hypothetical protein